MASRFLENLRILRYIVAEMQFLNVRANGKYIYHCALSVNFVSGRSSCLLFIVDVNENCLARGVR